MYLFTVLAVAALTPDAVCTAQLDHLLALYKEYGLPLPPPDAQLVQFSLEPGKILFSLAGMRVYVYPEECFLGFSLDGRTALGGFGEQIEVDSIASAKPDPTMLGTYPGYDALLVALQYHSRGWTFLSRAAYREWHSKEIGGLSGRWSSDEEGLAFIAWEHWMYRLSYDPGTPLPLVAKHLKRILPDEDPKGEFKADRELVRSLELALVPRNSRPGSDEALIDALIEVSGPFNGDREITEIRPRHYDLDALHTEPRDPAIVRRGFAAVPALLAHLNDDRLTRLVRYEILPPQAARASHAVRVKDVVLDLLEQLSGENFGDFRIDHAKRAAAARKWFAEVEKMDEEKHVLSRVLPYLDAAWVNESLFWLLCEKYPQRLPEVYRKLIDRHPNLEPFSYSNVSWRFAKAIAQSSLPVADKRKILEYAARQPDPHHRAAGVKFLRPFDLKPAHELLTAALERLSGRLSDGALTLAQVAAEGDDPRQWQALAKAARGADVGSRLELLKVIAEEPSPANRKTRLAFLAEYLTDDAVRDKAADPKRYEWDGIAGSEFERLGVRGFAAIQLAELLKLDVVPRVDWTAAQWAELHKRVRVAIAKELAP